MLFFIVIIILFILAITFGVLLFVNGLKGAEPFRVKSKRGQSPLKQSKS